MPAKTVVLTGVGRDRVGIVAEVAQVLYERGCNLLDSSMTLLRGEFALILMVELPPSQSVALLTSDLEKLKDRLGLVIHVRELSPEELKEPVEPENAFLISVYGADRPGIVAGVTKHLASKKINITDVQTKSIGSGVFVMILEVEAPAGMSEKELTQALAASKTELNVDISVQSLEAAEL